MKKTRLLIILIATSLLTLHSFAQENSKAKQNFFKHDIGISMGFFSVPLLIPRPYYPLLMPNLNLDYHYNFNAKHSIGFSYSIAYNPFLLPKWLIKSYIDEFPNLKKSDSSSIHNSIQIGYRINFFKAGLFTLYSSFYAGMNVVYFEIDHKRSLLFLPSLQITPLGVICGVKNTLNIEIGIGARGFLIIGYRYLFNK